jgi:hypothetical protein
MRPRVATDAPRRRRTTRLTLARTRTTIGRVRTWIPLLVTASLVTAAACGARTGLLVGDPQPEAEPRDASVDVTHVFDESDALDASEEPDVIDFPDANVVDCKDAGITYIYLISSENELLRFYPPDLTLTTIGTITCPSSGQPFSMAVNRDGVAYVLFNTGELFRVSTRTASCKPTGFISDPSRFSKQFGMGFSSNAGSPGETLFIAGADLGNPGATSNLGRIDPTTFDLAVVGPLSKPIGNPELTGTGDARLFAFGPEVPSSHLAEIDKATATIKSDVRINLDQSKISAWAFAFWGGDFYFFTSEQTGTSSIHRYTPGGSTTPPLLGQIGLTIVGAGVSTCAPSE